ncbi:MAG: transposase [Bacteroidales bacterium]|nr:transposase [Bacteroidales bacterium]
MEQFEKVIHLSCNALIVDGTRWVRSSLYNQLSKDCRRMQHRIASLTTERDSLKQELEQWTQPAPNSENKAQRQLARKDAAYQNLKLKFEQRKSQVKKLKEQINEFKKEKTNLIKQNVASQRRCAEFENENAIMQAKNDKFEQQIKELEEELKTLREEHSELELTNGQLKDNLEKITSQLNADSNNSGLPTSKTPIGKEKRKPVPNLRQKSDRRKGGQPGHRKNQLAQSTDELITGYRDHLPEEFKEQMQDRELIPEILNCPNCGARITDDMLTVREKEEIDFEIKINRIRHRFYEIVCSHCNMRFKIKIPNQIKEPAQYGPHIKSLICVLLKGGIVSVNRVSLIINSLLKLNISEGYICKLSRQLGEMCEDFSKKVTSLFQFFAIIGWDDTVVRANGKNICFRTYVTNFISLYTAHDQKNLQGLIDDGILTSLTVLNRVIHDHNTVNYNEIFNFLNAECNAHLLRDLLRVYENNKDRAEWTLELKNTISELINKRNTMVEEDSSSTSLPAEEINNFKQNLIAVLASRKVIVEQMIQEHEKRQRELGNKSNKIIPPESLLLELRIINRLSVPEYMDAYFAWMGNFNIPVTNNCSERALRTEKTHMKVSGQFASTETAEYHAMVMTYLETCKKNGINSFDAITAMFEGKPYTVESLNLVEHLDYKEMYHPSAPPFSSELNKTPPDQ